MDTCVWERVQQWFLNNINPEIFELQESLNRMLVQTHSNNQTLSTKHLEKSPTNLLDILLAVELIEESLISFTCFLLDSWKPTNRSSDLVPLSVNNNEPEQVISTVIPRIDRILSNIDDIIFGINTKKFDGKVLLEPQIYKDIKENASQRQIQFIDKFKRLRSNMSLLENVLYPTSSNQKNGNIEYKPPLWSVAPTKKFYFEVVKDGEIIDKICLYQKGHYNIGRLRNCDVTVSDATCSRQHAIIQFRPGDPDLRTGNRIDEIYIFDLGSTSGTLVNGSLIKKKAYFPLKPSDSIQFGQFTSIFHVRDGTEEGLIPPEPPIIKSKPIKVETQSENKNVDTKLPIEDNDEKLPVPLEINENEALSESESKTELPSGEENENEIETSLKKKSTKELKSTIKIKKLVALDRKKKAIPFSFEKEESEENQEKKIVSEEKIEQQMKEEKVEEKELKIEITKKLENCNSKENESPIIVDIINTDESKLIIKDESPKEDNNNNEKLDTKVDEIEETSAEKVIPPKKEIISIDPRSDTFDEDDYKRKMVEAYERQQRENAEILRKRKEQEAQGLLPVSNETPQTKEKTSKSTPKSKKKRWWRK